MVVVVVLVLLTVKSLIVLVIIIIVLVVVLETPRSSHVVVIVVIVIIIHIINLESSCQIFYIFRNYSYSILKFLKIYIASSSRLHGLLQCNYHFRNSNVEVSFHSCLYQNLGPIIYR